MKTTHHLLQGTKEWHEFRAFHFGASEASAMLGLSPYKSRSELLREKATGITPEVDVHKQKLFDRGHATEASARIILEAMIDDGLSPVTMSDGKLSASLDGLTFDGCIAFEHKLYNESLFNSVLEGNLPEAYQPQCQQVMMVSGAEKVIFVCSDGTAEKFVHVEVLPDAKWQERIRAGWAQFEIDLANYVYVEPAAVAVAAPVSDLPVLFVHAKGEVTETNMPDFETKVGEYLGNLNMSPVSDQEFADSKAIASKLRDGAKALQAKKAEMLAQTASIGEVATKCDLISKQLNAAALALEKKVDLEVENRKLRLIQKGKDDLNAHIASLGQRIDISLMPPSTADFAKAIKGKSKLDSMENGISTELARATIEASAAADKIEASIKAIDAAGHAFLFSDRANLVKKAPDDLALVIKSRIQDHEAAEAKRLEAERQRIRTEEEARATAKANAEAEAENKRIRAQLDAANIAPPVAQTTVNFHDVATTTAREVFKPAVHTGITGSARLLDRLDELVRQMTERELSDLCIHAAHILGERGKVAA